MTQYLLDLFLSTHFNKCEDFMKDWFRLHSKVHDKGNGNKEVEASLVQEMTHADFEFKHIGFNYGEEYSTNKLNTYISKNDKVLMLIESFFDVDSELHDNRQVRYYEPKNEPSGLYSDHMMITRNRQIRLYLDDDTFKILEIDECDLSKDEYFNLSLEYIMPSYELYQYARKYHKSCPNNAVIYFTEQSLKL